MATLKMTKAQFARQLSGLLRETYPTVTDTIVAAELENALSGKRPDNIIGMFVANNLKKIEITDK